MMMAIILLKILKKHWVLMIDGISPLKLGNDNILVKLIKRFLLQVLMHILQMVLLVLDILKIME